MLLPLSLSRHILCRRRSVTLFSADVLTPVLLVLFERILYRYSYCWMLCCRCSTFVVDTLSPLMCLISGGYWLSCFLLWQMLCHYCRANIFDECFAAEVAFVFSLANTLPLLFLEAHLVFSGVDVSPPRFHCSIGY